VHLIILFVSRHTSPEMGVALTAILIIMVLTLTFLGMRKLLLNQRSHYKTYRALKQLQSDPKNAASEIAKELCHFLDRRDLVETAMTNTLITSLRKRPLIGQFQINDIVELQSNEYLIITTCNEDYSSACNFRLRKNIERGQEELYCHALNNRQEEILLKSFSHLLFMMMEDGLPYKSRF
jgi:predicted nucleic acid-binding protein